jgi:tetratricopeptide (TPR) repeat protein
MSRTHVKHNTKLLLKRLSTLLIERDVRTGTAILERHFRPGAALDPEKPEGHALLFVLAQWVDLGFRDVSFLESQFTVFEKFQSPALSVSQYLSLKLAEIYLQLGQRKHDEAIGMLQALIHLHAGSLSPLQLFVSHFWLSRGYRQAGNFDRAYEEIKAARQQAEAMDADKLQAVAKIHESWLIFYRGDRRTALHLLDESERVLAATDHSLSRGNIAAARGRFIRSTGDYERALGFFEQAIRIYQEDHPDHPNLARALVNAAYIKRLIAQELRSRNSERATAAVHARSQKVADEAMDLLRAARQIYAHQHHQGGTGSVLINLGHLKLETGEIDSASEEADLAFALAERKNDNALKARARILQAYIQMAISEEQIDEPSSPLSSSQKALHLAEDAVSLAESTENRRLLAGAYITQGLTLTVDPQTDWELARSLGDKAAELLRDQDRDHLFRELGRLRSRIIQPATVERTLRRWLTGDVGPRTFQQVEEEFAEIVIPRVWMKMGRNISRVAQQLKVSPKKVRRALRNAQLPEKSNETTSKSIRSSKAGRR